LRLACADRLSAWNLLSVRWGIRPWIRSDTDIAQDTAEALKLRPAPADNVQAVVHNGHVTLTGTVDWLFQKEQAENAVRHVRGLLGLLNHITVKPKSGQRDVQRRIVRALHHNADLDARQITVTVSDEVATLTGTVGSWMQRDAAQRAAGSAPGIRRVDNEIVVVPPEPHKFEPPDEIC
jgi:osmotically-inducible protein OsmY